MPAGGCHCGAVRYEAERPMEAAWCHCADCRRVSGAPAVAWFTVRASDFRFTAGAPARYASSAEAERGFCAACGAQLTFRHRNYGGEWIDVTTATLDDPEAIPPREHIWTRSRLSWMRMADGLPEHSMEDRP